MITFATSSISPSPAGSSAHESAVLLNSPMRMRGEDDERLTERVEGALRATGYGALRAVAVHATAGVVWLRGRVSSYYLKQVAQATALAVPGTHEIYNGLEVVLPHSKYR